MCKRKYPATLRLEEEIAINNRHVWLWKIESENGVVNAWLLQWEEKSMEIIDRYFINRDEEKANKAFNRKIKEIVSEIR